MSLEKIAEQAVRRLVRETPGLEYTDEQLAEVRDVVEEALAGAVDASALAFREATTLCCGPDADLAHKINEETERRTQLLIANLSQDR